MAWPDADLTSMAQISGENFIFFLFHETADPDCLSYTGVFLF